MKSDFQSTQNWRINLKKKTIRKKLESIELGYQTCDSGYKTEIIS